MRKGAVGIDTKSAQRGLHNAHPRDGSEVEILIPGKEGKDGKRCRSEGKESRDMNNSLLHPIVIRRCIRFMARISIRN